MGSEWMEAPLGKVVDVTPSRNIGKGREVKFVGMSDVEENKKFISSWETREYKSGPKFQNSDTLFARITPCLENGKTAYVDFLGDGEVASGSTEFVVLTGREGKTLPEYVYYLMRSPKVRQLAIRSMTGTSGRQRVQVGVLQQISVAIPELPEQELIAKTLSDLDAKIRMNLSVNRTLEAMGRTLFNEWFVEKNVPTSTLKSSPAWNIGKLGDAANNIRDVVSPDEAKVSRYVGLEHLPRKTLSLTSFGSPDDVDSNKYRFRHKDILFGKLRPYFHKVVVAPFEGISSTDILIIRPKEHCFAFALFWLSSKEVIDFATARSTGTRMPRTNWNDVSSYEIEIPSIEVLKKFDEIANPLIEKILQNIEEIHRLEHLRDTLLPQLISGNIRIPYLKTTTENLEGGEEKSNQLTNFQEAILISEIVAGCSNENYSIDRLRYQKMSYFTKRFMGQTDMQEYAKMEAGPYNPKARYKGGESIAVKKEYITRKKGLLFDPGSKISEAHEWASRYKFGLHVKKVLDLFRFEKSAELELLATVDMSVLDLQSNNQNVDATSVLNYIESIPNWKQKLKKATFNLEGVERALKRLQELFPQDYQQVVVA